VRVVRVHPENLDRQKLPREAKGKGVWERRYREINDWERYLTDNGFKVGRRGSWGKSGRWADRCTMSRR
jgi:hypothetical protein